MCILFLSPIWSFYSWKMFVAIYMSHFFKKYFLQIDAKEHGSGGQGGAEADAGTGPGECSAESEPTWVNCLVGRIFWDFLWEKYWADQVAHKIQKKLSKIKVMVYDVCMCVG